MHGDATSVFCNTSLKIEVFITQVNTTEYNFSRLFILDIRTGHSRKSYQYFLKVDQNLRVTGFSPALRNGMKPDETFAFGPSDFEDS